MSRKRLKEKKGSERVNKYFVVYQFEVNNLGEILNKMGVNSVWDKSLAMYTTKCIKNQSLLLTSMLYLGQ
jgi:hypothetical protein